MNYRKKLRSNKKAEDVISKRMPCDEEGIANEKDDKNVFGRQTLCR